MRRLLSNFWFSLAWVGLLALATAATVGLVRDLGRDRALVREIRATQEQLQKLAAQRPFPSAANLALLQAGTAQASNLLAATLGRFQQPPVNLVFGQEWQTDLEQRLLALRTQAQAAGLRLPGPPKYYSFTFGHQRNQLGLNTQTDPDLCRTLAQVEWLCATVFTARCDLLEFRRPRLAGEGGTRQTTWTDRHLSTNGVARAVIASYDVTIGANTATLADLLERLANTPYGVIARVLGVDQTTSASAPSQVIKSRGRPPSRASHADEEEPLRATLQVDFITPLN